MPQKQKRVLPQGWEGRKKHKEKIKELETGLADENLAEDLLLEIKTTHNVLKEKLLPKVYAYGFLG
jgi:hypothetical protein